MSDNLSDICRGLKGFLDDAYHYNMFNPTSHVICNSVTGVTVITVIDQSKLIEADTNLLS